MHEPDLDFFDILRTLVAHEVEFIVVGGVCAVIHGAPIGTIDLDVVHSREAGNVDRLLAALEDLHARSRLHKGSGVKPDRSHLSSPGHQLLTTRAGSLDLLGAIGANRTYEDLLPHTTVEEFGSGLSVRVLDLETLIQIKEETGREKDRIVLPTLRATLAERRRRRDE